MNQTYTVFKGSTQIASGALEVVLTQAQAHRDDAGLLVFDDHSGRQVDFDLRGSREDMLARLAAHPALAGKDAAPVPRNGPGRPKLGVLSREVSLLPRHWQWLEQHPKGISAALRQLVEDARKAEPTPARARQAREAAGRFMTAMAGDLPGYEEASRALYARDGKRLAAEMKSWPKDIRAHALALAARAEALEQGHEGTGSGGRKDG